MGKFDSFMEVIDKKLQLSRRGFVKGAIAVGATASLYGCSKGDGAGDFLFGGGGVDDGTTDTTTSEVKVFYGSSGHNCGGRCVSRAEVSKGRIQRILTDESKYTSDGTMIEQESRNFPQTRACARCRSYKYRLYHPGRLRYPLKQLKKRGDLSGFIRITWEQALNEIAKKHKAVIDKYGVDGIYSLYAWGAATGVLQGASGGPLGAGGAGGAGGVALRYMGGAQASYFGSYSTHQYRYLGEQYTGADKQVNANSVATYTSNLVLWGSNDMSTRNPSAYAYIRATEDMKKRKPDSKVIFVGPSFSDTGVTIADEWVVSKAFTDPALIAGMIYHMLDNTFNLTTGELKPDPWLDVNYLDTMVYGFFDSPAYGLTEATGVIDATATTAGDRKINAVPVGKSYSSWILGNNNNAKTYSDTTSNYTAIQFTAGTGNAMKRWSPCSYTASKGQATIYQTKKDFTVAKTPAWASKITGVPEDTIKHLAEVFAKGGPITSTWSGGQQKQADGIANLFALQALHVITKNVGTYGAGVVWNFGPSVTKDTALDMKVDRPKIATYINNNKPSASCTAWHTAIKMAYADELKTAGYKAKYIPNWTEANNGTITTGDGNIYWDDGGTKAMIAWERNPDGTIKIDSNGYYEWKKIGGKPLIAGIRLMYNSGGNIFINQHENSNDSREMLEYLPLNNGDADTFCLVSFDNFLSPTPRYSDYVLPAATSWEQQDIMAPSNGTQFYISQVITPPGEAKPTWDFANELLKAYEKVDPKASGAAKDFTGGVPNQTIEALVKKAFRTASNDTGSSFYGMKWEEFLKNPYLPAKPDNDSISQPTNLPVMNAYRALDENTLKSAFIKTTTNVKTNEVNGSDAGYGNDFTKANLAVAPKSAWRFQVYSPVLTWQYEHKFEAYHGYLPADKQGQQHKDIEGDKFVLEIPVYYAYQDYFMEAYGGIDKISDLEFCLTTTHDRYRSHSSMAENPMLRELTHRVPGKDEKGNPKPANDYNNYAIFADRDLTFGNNSSFYPLNRTIGEGGVVSPENKDIASYSEIYINTTDARAKGIADGDLLQVENPIGAVRVVARLTKRCARGYVDLHQGCWYDPRNIDGKIVDVGGNCNTLMASQPSRIDHGNGQQSAMVKISKVNS